MKMVVMMMAMIYDGGGSNNGMIMMVVIMGNYLDDKNDKFIQKFLTYLLQVGAFLPLAGVVMHVVLF